MRLAQPLNSCSVADLKSTKTSLRLELAERALSDGEAVSAMRQAHDKNLVKLREEFERGRREQEARCERRLGALREALELRRKVWLAASRAQGASQFHPPPHPPTHPPTHNPAPLRPNCSPLTTLLRLPVWRTIG